MVIELLAILEEDLNITRQSCGFEDISFLDLILCPSRRVRKGIHPPSQILQTLYLSLSLSLSLSTTVPKNYFALFKRVASWIFLPHLAFPAQVLSARAGLRTE